MTRRTVWRSFVPGGMIVQADVVSIREAAVGSIIVCGGGMIGLSVAMMLAQDGQRSPCWKLIPQAVPATPLRHGKPGSARASPSSASRTICSPGSGRSATTSCRDDGPAGGGRVRLGGSAGGAAARHSDREPRAGDDGFRFVTGRRPVIESAFAAAAQEQPA